MGGCHLRQKNSPEECLYLFGVLAQTAFAAFARLRRDSDGASLPFS